MEASLPPFMPANRQCGNSPPGLTSRGWWAEAVGIGKKIPDPDWIRKKRRRAAGPSPTPHEGLEDFDAIDGDGTVFGPGDFVSYQPGIRHNSRTETGCVLRVCEWGKEAAAT